MRNVKFNLGEKDINMIKWGELFFVTNASIEVVKNAIRVSNELDENNGINEICDLIQDMGYFATWENFEDMRLEIKKEE